MKNAVLMMQYAAMCYCYPASSQYNIGLRRWGLLLHRF